MGHSSTVAGQQGHPPQKKKQMAIVFLKKKKMAVVSLRPTIRIFKFCMISTWSVTNLKLTNYKNNIYDIK